MVRQRHQQENKSCVPSQISSRRSCFHLCAPWIQKSLNEQEIRSIFIRPAIRNAGWTASQIREEYVITKGRIVARGGTSKRDEGKRADYVLFFKPHIPLAIIEAKDNNHSVSEGMQQAMEYAGLLMIPFVFSSNGDAFSFHNRMITDGEKEQTIALDEFPSPEVLWEMYKNGTGLTTEQETIIKEPYYADREDRTPYYYQRNAINLTVEAVMRGQNRILLVMATGTGKTFTAFQIIWRLWKAGVKKRILFLADRNALIDQTYSNDFSPFKDKMTIVRNRKVDKSYEIFLALYQGLTGEGDKEIFKQFSPSFFDLVIVDECHRGSAKADSAWREVLEYFSNATQIGMTATPKETKDISNIDYFGNPIYTYTLRQGIEDGFLAPYRVIRVVPDVGYVNTVGNQIGDAEKIGKRLFLNAPDGLLKFTVILRRLDAAFVTVNNTGKKSASPTGRVQYGLPQFWRDHFDNEPCHRARSIKFASLSCTLQIFEHIFVDAIEQVSGGHRKKVNIIIDLVNDLTEQSTRLHEVVDTFHDAPN